MFLGTFTPKFLGKGQISLPAKLRAVLGSDRAIITTGFEPCVYGFSLVDWQKISDQELLKPLSLEEGRVVRRQFFAGATEIDLDEQGRFVIPEYLRTYAGLKDNLIVIGAGDHFEIWDGEAYQSLRAGLG